MDEDYEEATRPSEPLSWRTLLYVGLAGAADVLGEVSDTLQSFAVLVGAAHNYEHDRRRFQEQAALELEMLTMEDFDA